MKIFMFGTNESEGRNSLFRETPASQIRKGREGVSGIGVRAWASSACIGAPAEGVTVALCDSWVALVPSVSLSARPFPKGRINSGVVRRCYTFDFISSGTV